MSEEKQIIYECFECYKRHYIDNIANLKGSFSCPECGNDTFKVFFEGEEPD